MQIIEAVNSVAAVGAHEFFILMDDNGNIVGQLNGFAVGSDGIPKVTNISGQLQVRSDYGSIIDSSTIMKSVVSGTQEQMMQIWNTGKACGDAINQQQMSYNLLDIGGKNSNAAFSTLATCMKLPDLDLTGAFTAVPGLHDIILPANTIKAIQDQHGLNGTTAPSAGGGEHSGGPGGVPGGVSGSGSAGGGSSGGGGGGHWQYPIAEHSIKPSPSDTTIPGGDSHVTIVGLSTHVADVHAFA
ncbi:hypothetical protein [Massilia orientalis]|uniref:Uncharacterized protein n=1 Tax=Massilia orientalis TaxID=3050128 RepID=A0ACC7M8Y8_9BURK|nr:hypothetical protein [Massilia sp. YIM B02787]